MRNVLNKLKKVTFRDVFGILKFTILILPALIYRAYLKVSRKRIWLISESENMARDNGFAFYKFLKNNHPEILSFYAINKKSPDYENVKEYGDIIKWASLKHYLLYMSCEWNISSHKEGNPNQTIFTILHLYLNLFNNRVFLQHGVLYQNFEMFHFKNTKFKLFITGAKDEYEYVKKIYGYKNNQVKYTGLARFDYLYDAVRDEKIILLIPTWRRSLDTKEKFEESKYYKGLLSLINNKKLEEILIKNDKYIYFYPHFSAQKYMDLFKTKNTRIKIIGYNDVFIQELLKKGSLLITDFSSIFTDFVYMDKPIIYYQYDSEAYYNDHVQSSIKSYFDFEKNGFGEVITSEENLIEKIIFYINENFAVEEKYKERVKKFFALKDKKNCERIFEEILRIDKNEK